MEVGHSPRFDMGFLTPGIPKKNKKIKISLDAETHISKIFDSLLKRRKENNAKKTDLGCCGDCTKN